MVLISLKIHFIHLLMYSEIIEKARDALGSYAAIGNVCGVSGRAVMKWRDKGYPPRTEYTGETCYAEKISGACGEKGVYISVSLLRPKLVDS